MNKLPKNEQTPMRLHPRYQMLIPGKTLIPIKKGPGLLIQLMQSRKKNGFLKPLP
jgi:hypothetical protein